MTSMAKLSDQLWNGVVSTHDAHPWAAIGDLEEMADGIGFIPSFGNVIAVRTGEGVVLVDTGSIFVADQVHEQVRSWSPHRLHTAVYTHGHVDHVFGVGRFETEAQERGWAPPRVVAHEALPARFDRYTMTAGYNLVINQRQFQATVASWPTDYRYPDETYREAKTLTVGGTRLELRHARGETDDHTWVFLPERRVLCTGDLFVWSTPNAGNPQKVQRYASEWAVALRRMAELEPEILLPGHGVPVIGRDRVHAALTDTAELLESLHLQTVTMMNEGARLNDIIHAVRPPAHLLTKPYLQPVFDEPEFIVRNIWRLYGGWYDGDPAALKPAPSGELAGELATLAGGARRLADRARELAQSGNLRLAGHLAELAAQASPKDLDVHAARAAVFEQRAAESTSTMAKGIFSWAARESHDAAQVDASLS